MSFKIVNGLSLYLFFITPVFAGIENRSQNVDDEGGSDSQDVQLNGGIGLFDGFELTFDLPYSFTDNNVNNEDGVNDFTLRPEWMFIRETDIFPAMSLAGVN